jgi:hypothetical protein
VCPEEKARDGGFFKVPGSSDEGAAATILTLKMSSRKSRLHAARSHSNHRIQTRSIRSTAIARSNARARSTTTAALRIGARPGNPNRRQGYHLHARIEGTASSRIRGAFHPALRRDGLGHRAAGAVVIGKTTATGSRWDQSNENSAFSPARESLGGRSHSRQVERRLNGVAVATRMTPLRSAQTPADRSSDRPPCGASSA